MEKVENTTLDRILKEARKEFLEKGYQKASLREIVKKAGLTTGAFYGYYKNKETLFDALVGEQYHEILNIYSRTLEEFFNTPPEEQYDSMIDTTYKCMLQMKDYIYENFDTVKMLLCCSDGTKYKDMVPRMAKMDAKATHDFARTMEVIGNGAKKVNPFLEHVLTSAMFNSFFELVVHDVPEEDSKEYIRQLLEFYSAGWGKIMGF